MTKAADCAFCGCSDLIMFVGEVNNLKDKMVVVGKVTCMEWKLDVLVKVDWGYYMEKETILR